VRYRKQTLARDAFDRNQWRRHQSSAGWALLDYATTIVVIKGAYTHNGKKYGPGSYLYIPGGDKHETAGAEDSESIFYIEQQGPFDLIPVEPTKAAK
jgi:hypothetical protein